MAKIKLTNSVIIAKESVEHQPLYVNQADVLVDKNYVTSFNWTATKDCVAFVISGGGPILLNSVQIVTHGTNTGAHFTVYLRNGDNIKCNGYNGWTSYFLKAFGIYQGS